MPRPIWSGSVAFGLVNVPVRLYPAVSEHRLEFHLVHEKDNGPIGYQKVCKLEDRPVPDDEITKAFEVRKGELVFMSDEDFEQAQVEGPRTIDVSDFVPYGEIDPIYFASTYLLGPAGGAEKVYSLFVRALEDSELAAIGTYVMRQRQHLGALRVREGVLTLEQLHFADEIRPVDEIRPSRQRIGEQELAMARQLIEAATTSWKPERYEDTYRDRLKAAIDAKRKGKEIRPAAEVEEEEPADLLEALRMSIEQRKHGATTGGRTNGSGRKGKTSSLERLSKTELSERARRAGIEGRSKMSKDELVDALRAA